MQGALCQLAVILACIKFGVCFVIMHIGGLLKVVGRVQFFECTIQALSVEPCWVPVIYYVIVHV